MANLVYNIKRFVFLRTVSSYLCSTVFRCVWSCRDYSTYWVKMLNDIEVLNRLALFFSLPKCQATVWRLEGRLNERTLFNQIATHAV
jgi:hypothetical protein